jgi:hypothetical protein
VVGSKTYLRPGGHPSATARWVPSISIRADAWNSIEATLGRALTDAERQRLHEGIELHRAFMREPKVSAQDVKETLVGLAAMAPALALRAYANADGWTHAEIASAMLRAGIRDGERLANPAAADVSHYANEALLHGIQRRGGRGDPTTMLARLILKWWKDLRGAPPVAAVKPGYASPLVMFADVVFRAADAPACDLPGVAARLRKAMPKSRAEG